MVAAAVGAGEVLAHLDDQEPVGVGGGAVHLVDVGARRGATGCTQPSASGGAPGGDHHPRGQRLEDRHEPPEVGRGEADVGAAVAEEPLERAVEAAQVVDVRVGEEVGEHA